MNDHLVQAENRLVDCLQLAVRGPRRNGLFALWLLVRVCDDTLPPIPLSGRAQRRRLDALEKRLSSLSLPASLRRALISSIRELAEGTDETAVTALQQLVEPANESIGRDAADAIALAVRSASRTQRLQPRASK
jgi:hypothetical protein